MSEHVRFIAGLSENKTACDHVPLSVTGSIPTWLRGTLYRNGPASWQVGETTLQHWFDGFAKIHAFSFTEKGEVIFSCRMLESQQYTESLRRGRLWRRLFATQHHRPWYRRIYDLLFPNFGDNALVNIQPIGGSLLALTETPRIVKVHPQTLAGAGEFYYNDSIPGQNTTAHPVRDPKTGALINLMTKYGKTTTHQFTSLEPGKVTRDLIGTITATEPSYHHSLGLTDSYIIFTEWPFVVMPLKMILGKNTVYGSYKWKPELGLRIRLLHRKTGEVLGPFTTDPFFGFHHVNAWDDGDTVVFEVPTVAGSHVFDELLMEKMRVHGIVSFPQLRRFVVNYKTGQVHHQEIGSGGFDFPIIDERNRCQPTVAVFGCGVVTDSKDGMLNNLVRRSGSDGTDQSWSSDGCFPGEPIFVAKPGGAINEGVLLSVVMDANTASSFLLVLDASTMQEIARAPTPTVVPFGFHGCFVAKEFGSPEVRKSGSLA